MWCSSGHRKTGQGQDKRRGLEDRRQTEDRQKTDRRQKTEDRRQKTEDRRQKTEDRRQEEIHIEHGYSNVYVRIELMNVKNHTYLQIELP